MIKVRVPATSANIGPGFDCLGMALNLYNSFSFEEIEEGLEIQGCESEFATEENLIYTSMKKTFHRIGYRPKGIKIVIENDIPISRGLGSSASCIIAGIIGANELAGGVLRKNEIVELSTEIEGHPDNVVPAFIGGMTVAVMDEDKVHYNKIPMTKELKLCALIPEFRLSTQAARGVLPKSVPHRDGVFNVGRVALLISSLVNGNLEALGVACQDKLHQDYRGQLIDGYGDIIKKCRELGCFTAFLSGAGPTIMTVVKDDDDTFIYSMENFLKNIKGNWSVKPLKIDSQGVVIEKI